MPTPRHDTQLHGLTLRAHALVDALHAGTHPTLQPGHGSEFHDYRPYAPGDDVADVDWKLYGRTDRHYLRRHQRTGQLQAWLVVDASASMDFAGPGENRDQGTKGPRDQGTEERGQGAETEKRTDSESPAFPSIPRPLGPSVPSQKLAHAQVLAAALAMLLVRQGDQVGLMLTGAQGAPGETQLAPGGTWAHAHRLTAMLEAARTGDHPAQVGDALAALGGRMRGRGLVVVLSDLLDEPGALLAGIDRLRAAGSEVLALQVLTPAELDLRLMGSGPAALQDPEADLLVHTDPSAVARGYHQLMQQHLATIRQGCLARGGDWQLVRTDVPALETLRHCLHRRQQRRGGWEG